LPAIRKDTAVHASLSHLHLSKSSTQGCKKPSTGQNNLGPENPAQVPFVRESVSASKRRDEPDISSSAPPVNTRIRNFPTQSANHPSSNSKT
jgi:hypothetical protein